MPKKNLKLKDLNVTSFVTRQQRTLTGGVQITEWCNGTKNCPPETAYPNC